MGDVRSSPLEAGLVRWLPCNLTKPVWQSAAFLTWSSSWWGRCSLERLVFVQCAGPSAACPRLHLGRAGQATSGRCYTASDSVGWIKMKELSVLQYLNSCKWLGPSVVPQRSSANAHPSSLLPAQLPKGFTGCSSTLCSALRARSGRYKLLAARGAQSFGRVLFRRPQKAGHRLPF